MRTFSALIVMLLLSLPSLQAQQYFSFNYYSDLTYNGTNRFEVQSDVWGGTWESIGIPAKTQPDPEGEPYDISYLMPFTPGEEEHWYKVRACNQFGCSVCIPQEPPDPVCDEPFKAFGVVVIGPPPAQPPTLPIRINTGGPQFTDGAGLVWLADAGFTGGTSYSVTRPINGTADDVLYQTERYSSPPMAYAFAVPNGTYTVKFLWAELFQTTAGARVFSVTLEGTTVISNLDIFAQTGGRDIAFSLTRTVTVSDGMLNIGFINSKDFATIGAIEITVPPTNQPPIANAGPDQTVNTATVTLDGSGSKDPDGTIVTVVWREGATVVGTLPVVTLNSVTAGKHTYTLTVQDNNGAASAPDSVDVVVTAATWIVIVPNQRFRFPKPGGFVEVELLSNGESVTRWIPQP